MCFQYVGDQSRALLSQGDSVFYTCKSYDIKIFSVLLALWEGIIGVFRTPHKRSVMQRIDIFVVLHLKKLLKK